MNSYCQSFDRNKLQKWSQNQESKATMTGGGVLHIFRSTQPTIMKAANLQSPKQNVIATIKLQQQTNMMMCPQFLLTI